MDGTVALFAEHFGDGEAVHQHEDDDGGEGHTHDAEAENFLGDAGAGERSEGGGELDVAAFRKHGAKAAIGFWQGVDGCALGGDSGGFGFIGGKFGR